MGSITFYIELDTRTKNKDGTFPVKLKITYNREYRRLGIIDPHTKKFVSLSKTDFEITTQKIVRNPELKYFKELFAAALLYAKSIIRKIDNFSFDKFKQMYLNRKTEPKLDIISRFEDKIQTLKNNGQISTAGLYRCALSDLLKYSNKLSFKDITPNFLKGYEQYALSKKTSKTTIAIYLRNLRGILNEAIQDKIINADNYPFSKKGYTIPTGNNIKKALRNDGIKAIFEYEPINQGEERAKDFWIFSYLCNGMNFKDILMLKPSNIDGDYLNYVREKTKNTLNQTKIIRLYLHPIAKEIIKKYAVINGKKDDYLLNILDKSMTPQQQFQRVKSFIRSTNKYLEVIGAKIGIGDFTTYAARHSFATKLKRSGVSSDYIKDALGHSSVTTTENYLASFEDESLNQAASKLTDFMN